MEDMLIFIETQHVLSNKIKIQSQSNEEVPDIWII